ncbi:MAG: dihydrofolate reductase, partial [Alphaproteobacteria bacterium]|nr:dihydrofolate reductase [Alphaproteobacteria bacterium]
MISRIGNADCVLLKYNAKITKSVLNACPNIKYIGMGCSYYGDAYSNLDMAAARDKGIVVSYLKDYGDEGVADGVLSQLISLLHGFGKLQWREMPHELTGLKIGIVGLGMTGLMTARALKFMGADIYYFSRTRKKSAEDEGIKYMPLDELLRHVDILSSHVNRDVIFMNKEQFDAFGNGKVIIGISLGRFYDLDSMKKWLDTPGNYHICDLAAKTGDNDKIINHPRTMYTDKLFGYSEQ